MITVQSSPLGSTAAQVSIEDFSTARRRSLDALRGNVGRGFGVAICGVLTAWAIHAQHLSEPALLPLFLFFVGLSILSVVLPASGPRGQRVGLIPAVGLAASLLLPPIVALLPLLLANTAYAFSRDQPVSRRGAFERGLWLLLAMLAGGLLRVSFFPTLPR